MDSEIGQVGRGGGAVVLARWIPVVRGKKKRKAWFRLVN